MGSEDRDIERYRVGDLIVDIAGQRVARNGQEIALPNLSFDLLKALIRHAPNVVTHDQLMDEVWPGLVVSPETVSKRANLLRASLSDDTSNPRYFALVRGRGYRLAQDFEKLERDVVDTESPTHRTSRKILFAIIGMMSMAVLYFVVEHYVLEIAPSRTSEDHTQHATLPDRKLMIAVLPLDNISSDPEQEYFSDGLTEEIIAQLGGSQRDHLGVIARTSVMFYKGTNKRIDEIGAELGVDYVLEGSVRRDGNRVRITAQLIQVSDQTHLWAESFERDLDNIFALQSEVAQRVTRTLAIELLPTAKATPQEAQPVGSGAYEAYLKGRFHENIGGRNGYLRAKEYYEEAIREDPGYALPYAALGHIYGMLAIVEYITMDEAERKSWEYTRKAAELDPDLAEVMVNFADFTFYKDRDWLGGEAGFRRAFETNPGSESVVWHYALCLHVLGRFEEVIGLLERALRLDPHSRQLNNALIAALLDSRQYERAIEQYQKMIVLEPKNAGIYNSLGNVFGDLGRDDEAVEAYLKARSLTGDSTDQVQALRDAYRENGIRGYWLRRAEHLMETRENVSSRTLANIYTRLGEKDQALAWMEKAAQGNHISPLAFAGIYTRLGENDKALALLEESFDERNMLLAWINVARLWDPLRDDPRFQDLLRRMKFPE